VKGNTNGAGIAGTRGNLDIEFHFLVRFAENPHFSNPVQSVFQRAFGVVVRRQGLDNFFALGGCNLQSQQGDRVFSFLVSEKNVKGSVLDKELIQTLFYLIFCSRSVWIATFSSDIKIL